MAGRGPGGGLLDLARARANDGADQRDGSGGRRPHRIRDRGWHPDARTAKVKVADPGQSPEQDEERLAAVRDALGPIGKIRIDVNGAWDLETATRLLTPAGHL